MSEKCSVGSKLSATGEIQNMHENSFLRGWRPPLLGGRPLLLGGTQVAEVMTKLIASCQAQFPLHQRSVELRQLVLQ